MPKGYWIAHVDVSDAEGYKDYVRLNAIAFAKYKPKFLVRGGQFTKKAGEPRARHVVLEFDSYEKALACYESPEYQAAVAVRNKFSSADVIVIEGYDGAQP
jgi:uncharacterized protein (DUF1330 family)